MKKLVVMLGAVVCISWAASAQTNSEYSQMNEWLFRYMLNGVTSDPQYSQIKQEWSMFGDKIYQEIKASLPPVDPSITAAIENMRTSYHAEAEQKAQALGYASFDDLYMATKKGSTFMTQEIENFFVWYKTRDNEIYESQKSLMKAYNDELNSRFQAAFIDAVKKLQENSASMQ